MAKDVKKIRTTEVESVELPKRGAWKLLWLPVGLLLALSAGSLTGVLASYYMNNSRYSTEVSALATYRPPQVTTIYADDGETVLAEFALEKRIPIKSEDTPQNVKDALIAVEDYRFYDHIGIDPIRIAGAAVRNITSGKTEGASTITQQLAKNLFLYKDKTYARKFNEWLIALQIERLYTKDQILEMYMNYVFLGAGSYGFEAGSRTYFNKSLKELSLGEAALLAAIPKANDYSPTRNMAKATERRNIVLDQMTKYFPDRYSQADVNAAKAKPIELAPSAYYQSLPKSSPWDYPVEEVRKYLEEKYTTRVAQGGLKVYTTINVDAQKQATKVIREGLRNYDRTRSWRSDYDNILVDDATNQPLTEMKDIDLKLKSFKHADWYNDEYSPDEYIKGLVMKVNPANDTADVRFGKYNAVITAKDMGRSGKKPASEFKPGMLAEFKVRKVNNDNQTLEADLSQVPEVQAGLVTINAHTGEVVAMIGGYDYHTSKFNNATQGLRQTGSCYKPFVYTAAVEDGMTPESIVSGAPIRRGGWQPHNYDGSVSCGNVPMKTALAKSLNIPAVHLLEQVGIQAGAQMVRRFGITNPMAPSLPSALGASEASLLEMTSAYSSFPNKGIRETPHLIRKVYSRDGSLLEEWGNTTSKVTSEYVALTMVELMRGVTGPGGTAAGVSAAGHPVAGKTGTVNDHTDVWFIGYTPTYATGIWMGNPLKKENLGDYMTGGHGAMPYFNNFMNVFMKGKPQETFPKPPDMPTDIKSLAEQRKREELEKLEKADAEGKKYGTIASVPVRTKPRHTKTGDPEGGNSTDSNIADPSVVTPPPVETTKTPTPKEEPPTVKKPEPTPVKKVEPPVEKPEEGTKRKGKKGDG